MSNVEVLLEKVLIEIQGLRSEMQNSKIDTCSPEDALKILGVNNRNYLKYFIDKGLITRRKGGKHFVYYKSECLALADAIRNNNVMIPSIREILNIKN